MIKKYLETRKLKGREREITARLDELWNAAKKRRDGEYDGQIAGVEKWRDTYDFFKNSEKKEYDRLAVEHWNLSGELEIESPHFSPKRHGAMEGDNSPTALTTVRNDNHKEVTFKEEDGFFVAYRGDEPDPDIDPVAVEEWGNIVVDIDEDEVRKNTEQRNRLKELRARYKWTPKPQNPPY